MRDHMALGGFCKECNNWTWVQGDEEPAEFLEPDQCGSCGEELENTGEFALLIAESKDDR